MSGDKLRVEYTALSGLSKSFTNEAHEIETLLRQVTRCADDLMRQGWSGHAAQAFTHEFGEVALPATKTLAQLLSEVGDLLTQVSGIYQEAEQAVGALFKHGSGNNQSSGAGATGHAVDITKYQNGVDGWSLISTDGSKGFTPNELVNQTGPMCALYGPLNLLIESGYDVSQVTADTYVSIKKIQ